VLGYVFRTVHVDAAMTDNIKDKPTALMAVRLSTREVVHLYFALLIVVTISNLMIGRFTRDILLLTAVVIPMLVLTLWDVRQAKNMGVEALFKGFTQNVIIVFLLFVAATAISSTYYGLIGKPNPNDLNSIANFYRNLFSIFPFTLDNLLKDIIVTVLASLLGSLITKTFFK